VRQRATALRFWYDTVAHGSLAVLRCAHTVMGARRSLYGSDYQYQAGDGYTRSLQYIRDAAFSSDPRS